jgi:hypothetical protein
LTRLPRRQLWIAAAGLAVLGLLAGLFARQGEARGSALSRGPNGWRAARRYLEARGARVRLLARAFEPSRDGGVLVLTFPWQRGATPELGDELDRHLRRGGQIMVAYSGESGNLGETVVLTGLGLPPHEERKATLDPLRWRRFSREEWELRPVAGGPPLRVWAPRYAPELPKEAVPLYRGPRKRVLLAALARGKGRIWIVPADAFANARLGNPGNAALLETLRRRLGDRWIFDEYHHGLTAAGPGMPETAAAGRTLDLILAHLAVLYLAALWTLSRRFGPPWSELPAVTGSTGSFLLGLGALHHRLGHHREAARRLLERVRELDRDADLPAELDRRATQAGPRELVALAREVARRRTGRPAPEEISIERETAA